MENLPVVRRPPISHKARARALDALGAMAKHGLSLRDATRQFKTSPEVVRRVGRSTGALRKVEGRWMVRPTARATIPRAVLTPDGWQSIRLWGFQDADLLRAYARAVESRNMREIAKFRDKTIRDARGRTLRLITDRRVLARLDRAGELQPPPRAFGGY